VTPGPVFKAPAKVNLYLHVLGRRPDGYHLLDSLVAFADLSDRISLNRAAEFELTLSGPFAKNLDAGEGNLALKAARALAEAAGLAARPMAIELEKNIPPAAGLGGGSADAAAVLMGLSKAWGIHEAVAKSLAPGLGADVPVCFGQRPVFMAGVGEKLGPEARLPDAGLVLANPGLPLDTAKVFAAFDAEHGTGGADNERARPALDPAPRDAGALAAALAATANDLTEAALELAPVVGQVRAMVSGLKGCRLARMSGSGATCFGLFDDIAAAKAGAQALSAAKPGWWCWGGGFAG
jgi:4-diphosphocytidyl-2-C-methyl-D-erythritol kinase